MKIKVIFDSAANDRDLHTGWGLSLLINETILFDTGQNGKWLLRNMRKLRVNIDKIETIVISHNHWDHTGGLEEMLKVKKDLRIICPSLSEGLKSRTNDFNGTFIESKKATQIAEDIYTTGSIPTKYRKQNIEEQALIIKTAKGLAIITGCAHPGIVKILDNVKKIFPQNPIHLIAGGFHLLESPNSEIEGIASQLKDMRIANIGPTHCTGKTAEKIFKEMFGTSFISLKVGKTIDL